MHQDGIINAGWGQLPAPNVRRKPGPGLIASNANHSRNRD